jgi:hypothetical protein
MNMQQFDPQPSARGELPQRSGSLNTAPNPTTPYPETLSGRTDPLDTPRPFQVPGSLSRVPSTSALQPILRHRRLWLPPLLFLLILLFVAGGIITALRAAHLGGSPVALPARNFSISTQTTVNITNDVGSVHIHTGKGSLITVRATVDQDIFGMQPTLKYMQSATGLTIGIEKPGSDWLSASGVALDVTVPVKTDLAITTTTGDVSIDDVEGKISIKGGTGNVNMSETTLVGESEIQTTTGKIAFSGGLADNAQCTMQSETGSVAVLLPAKARTSISAQSNTNTVETTFEKVKVSSAGVGQKAAGDTNAKPTSTLLLESETGAITIDAQIA